jgi:enoyl-CoA hydratase
VAEDGPIGVEREGDVVVITLDDGKANAVARELSAGLSAALGAAEADQGVGAVVVAGRPGRFSGGFDLSVIGGGDRAAVKEMVDGGGAVIRQMYGCGVPVVAACTGHAVAAGALMLLGCDQRIGPASAGVKIGLNEVAIGLTLPPWALAIAAERLSRRHLQTAVANATLYDGAGAVDAGFLDRVVEPDRVVAEAVETAKVLCGLDRRAYAATVLAIRRPTLDAMDASLAGSPR